MARERVLPGYSGLRAQVIIGFSLTIIAVGVAGYIAFKSTRQLVNSLVTLTQPNPKLERLEMALSAATYAENSIRLYSISHKNQDFNDYKARINEVDTDIKVLQTLMNDDPAQRKSLRRVKSFVNQKMRNIQVFIEFKRVRDSLVVASINWDQLSQSAKDSAKMKLLTRTTDITTFDTIYPQKSNAIATAAQKRNFFKRLLGLNKPKKVEPTVALPRVLAKTRTIVDSSYVPIKDTTYVSRFRTMYDRANQYRLYIDEELNRRETQLIRLNSNMIKQLLAIIDILKKTEQVHQEAGAIAASDIGNRSIMIIAMVAGAALLTVILFTLYIFQGIRKNIRLNQELVKAKQRAEKLASVKEEFLANMSHEIRTPLNAIIGYSERLSQTPLDKKQNEFITAVQKSSDLLLATVNDILDFSKIEAGKLRIDAIPFEPAAVVREVVDALQLHAEKKHLALQFETSEIDDLFVTGDPIRLKQILINLTNNGVKFTDKGFVKIICSREYVGADIVLTFRVADTGMGIDSDKQVLIFDAFSQADASSTRRFSGTGLGLAICKKLVELQNGTLRVESQPEEGSVFTVEIPYLPANEERVTYVKQVAGKPNMEQIKNKHILLVDDDEYNIQLTRMMLDEWGIRYDAVRSGLDAMELVLRNNYDLVLTDIHMPEVSGIQLTRYIRSIEDKQKSTIPIIAFTANVMKDDLENYRKAGINDFLLKPFTSAQVLDKILTVLDVEYELIVNQDEINAAEKPEISHTIINHVVMAPEIIALRRFTGDDLDALSQVIKSFIKNGEINLKDLNKCLNNGDDREMGELAHKMLTPFSQIGDNPVVPILVKLERLINEDLVFEEKQALVNSLNTESVVIFELLKKAMV
jgi:signal transduction histidine kinase/DNA-binding response OmpR family regulator/CHASE3 domain sensor protein